MPPTASSQAIVTGTVKSATASARVEADVSSFFCGSGMGRSPASSYPKNDWLRRDARVAKNKKRKFYLLQDAVWVTIGDSGKWDSEKRDGREGRSGGEAAPAAARRFHAEEAAQILQGAGQDGLPQRCGAKGGDIAQHGAAASD